MRVAVGATAVVGPETVGATAVGAGTFGATAVVATTDVGLRIVAGATAVSSVEGAVWLEC